MKWLLMAVAIAIAMTIVTFSTSNAWGLLSGCWEDYPIYAHSGDSITHAYHGLQNWLSPDTVWVTFEMIDDGGVAQYLGDSIIAIPPATERQDLPIVLIIPDSACPGNIYSYSFSVRQIAYDLGNRAESQAGYYGGCDIHTICPSDGHDTDGDCLCSQLDNCPGAYNPTQADNDSDGLGNACCCVLRGDVDGVFYPVGAVNVSDLTYLVNYLFKSVPAPGCPSHGDVDASGATNVADLSYLVEYLFKGGPAPMLCTEGEAG